jgi:hypothetical protein
MIHAILADFSVAQELRAGTKKPEIVKSLHHRDSSLAARAVYRRRNHHKRIVNVHNIRPFPLEERPEVAVRVAGPDGADDQRTAANGREFLDLMIAALVRHHLVPAALEDSLLLLEDNIFAARLLIFVMDQ